MSNSEPKVGSSICMGTSSETNSGIDMDCAVCLQKCHHPTKLPCGHIFCFLCVKGVALQNRKCAMCRAPIPPDYLDNPVLLETLTDEDTVNIDDQFQWYYEGRNGWWKYDERSNHELEMAFSSGASECSLLLAGALYRVHFDSMLQTRRNDTSRRRRVKRDTPTLPAKGVAGIKIISNNNPVNTKDNTEEVFGEEPTSDVGEETDTAAHIVTDTRQQGTDNNDYIDLVDTLSTLNLGSSPEETHREATDDNHRS